MLDANAAAESTSTYEYHAIRIPNGKDASDGHPSRSGPVPWDLLRNSRQAVSSLSDIPRALHAGVGKVWNHTHTEYMVFPYSFRGKTND